VGSASDYLEDKILDHLLGRTTYTAPATIYGAIWTVPLSESSTGSSPGEVNGAGYARVAVTNDVTNFPAASGGSKSNALQIRFPMAQATWGTIKAFALTDAASAGNILFSSPVQPEVYVDTYDTFVFAPGDLLVSVD
jgi:hypothetical protein